MRFYDAFGYRKADTHAICLAGHERLEKASRYFVGNAWSRVGHLDHDMSGPVSHRAYNQVSTITFAHGFDAVAHEVGQDLLDLTLIDHDSLFIRNKREDWPHALLP